ncbi:metallophosphoesterase [Bergeriella denitrificans]|uniref:Diadenosine tetraphosphatase n=1 Tax=Bergeriella denitrificans TaxID=494 RepID=A0A378UH12_BERDE|nr:metallophosphoesterase [Bergeriella denitrificans]STZ76606.1 diadenosine tetraphosphatase [Bergeriella denitrificans]
MNAYRYRRTLPDAPLDIVGDVHGEFAAFQALLRHLGYRADGSHPEGRRLVFVGDLCDRGPDSPAMLAWAERAVKAGYAFVALGNHELNLLVDDAKDGSGWFFTQRAEKDAANYAPWQQADAAEKAAITAWLAEQPLIWEREDIRIVHAAWLPEQLARLDAAAGEGLVAQYRRFDRELTEQLQSAPWYADYRYEQQHYADLAEQPGQAPPPMPATAQYDLARSRAHPIRALTSGVERLSAEPFFAGGRWRGTERCPWWTDYREDIPVVIGHYWRAWQASENAVAAERNLFPSAPNAWHGAKQNVFCVDFSVGASWRARKYPHKYTAAQFRLAALRWPENILVADNGETLAVE